MNTSPIRSLLVVALALAASLYASAADKPPARKTLVDFTHVGVEQSGPEIRQIQRYEYAWNAWQNKIVFMEKRGILIPALSGEGVLGANNRLVFGKATHAEIELVIGNRNEAEAVAFSLTDADGTQEAWDLTLKDRPKGVGLSYLLRLTSSNRTENAGKKPGLDLAKLKKWEIKGNWQPAKVEVLIVRINATTPAPAEPAPAAAPAAPAADKQ